MSVIYLIRHGQASFGQSNYDQLSELGTEQSTLLGKHLEQRGINIDKAVHGDMQRHHQTAEHCLKQMNTNIIPAVDDMWNEYDFKDIITRYNPKYKNQILLKADMLKKLNPHRDFQIMFEAAISRWMSGEYDDYAETWVDFSHRCNQALKSLTQLLDPSETACVFTSGGVISAIVKERLMLSDEQSFKLSWSLNNCGITKILSNQHGFTLSSLNEHGYLEGHNKKLITYR